MKVLVLTEKDIRKTFTMKDAIQADKDAMEFYSKGETNIPLRINIDVPNKSGQSLYMPGYVEGANALGIKIVSIYPGNSKKGKESVLASVILLDDETGEVCSIIDGTYLTRLRTGAVAGLATDILATKDSKIFALFGTGGQAETQLEAILNVRAIEEVRVYSRNKEKRDSFVKAMNERFSGVFQAKIISSRSPAEAVIDADIITVATTSKSPVFDGKLIKKGVLVNGIGSYTPEMQEIDEYILMNANKIYMDTKEGVLSESGDFITPIKNGNLLESDLTGEIGEVIIGKIESRENDEEIIVFKSVGTAVLDVVIAKQIYDKAIKTGIGQMIEM